MQRAGGGNADFVDAGADRGFDVLAAAGARISLPFTPGRNHRHSPATFALATIFIKSSWRQHRLCWNLNVLLQIIGAGKIIQSRYRGCSAWSPPLPISTVNCGEVLLFGR